MVWEFGRDCDSLDRRRDVERSHFAVIDVCRHGVAGLWRKKSCVGDNCPVVQKKYEVVHFIFPLVGICLLFYMWGDVKRSAVQVAQAARSGTVAACAAH